VLRPSGTVDRRTMCRRCALPILPAGGDRMRTKLLRIVYSGAALATLLLAAGAKWKVN